MNLIQLLLPVYKDEKEQFQSLKFAEIKKELTDQFGGITTYSHAPATGLWKENGNKTVIDAIITYEVVASQLDKAWWQTYKEQLQQTFAQEDLIIWALALKKNISSGSGIPAIMAFRGK